MPSKYNPSMSTVGHFLNQAYFVERHSLWVLPCRQWDRIHETEPNAGDSLKGFILGISLWVHSTFREAKRRFELSCVANSTEFLRNSSRRELSLSIVRPPKTVDFMEYWTRRNMRRQWCRYKGRVKIGRAYIKFKVIFPSVFNHDSEQQEQQHCRV